MNTENQNQTAANLGYGPRTAIPNYDKEPLFKSWVEHWSYLIMKTAKFALMSFVMFVLAILVVCGDLQPQDSMFVMLGNVGRYLLWFYLVVFAVVLIYELAGKEVPPPNQTPKVFRVLHFCRWFAFALWIAAFGHWFLALIWTSLYVVDWAIHFNAEAK